MEEKDLKNKVFDKIITDYGRNILKIVQLPNNTRVLTQILKEEENTIDIDYITKKVIRIIVKS